MKQLIFNCCTIYLIVAQLIYNRIIHNYYKIIIVRLQHFSLKIFFMNKYKKLFRL